MSIYNDCPKMSMISQSTNDSGSASSNSDSEKRRLSLSTREWRSFDSLPQRLDYSKQFEAHSRPMSFLFQHSPTSSAVRNKSLLSAQPSTQLPAKRFPSLAASIILILLISIALITHLQSTSISTTPSSPPSRPIQIIRGCHEQVKIADLFNPVQVKYIQSYDESAAAGKYFYWDLLGMYNQIRGQAGDMTYDFYLLAEEYFKLIKEQLMKFVWMEESSILQFLGEEFTAQEIALLKKKIWALRDKCSDISIEVNFNQRRIWRYKHCHCVDPATVLYNAHSSLANDSN